jgi:hypothetical protein
VSNQQTQVREPKAKAENATRSPLPLFTQETAMAIIIASARPN